MKQADQLTNQPKNKMETVTQADHTNNKVNSRWVTEGRIQGCPGCLGL